MKKIITSTFGLLSSACYLTRSHQPITENNNYDLASPKPCFKSRKQHLRDIMDNPVYDIVVIGGGSVGAGVLLDAASRGYKCLLLEGSDFASGASSKSTKLIHGGVRYLQQVFEFSLQPLKNRIEKYKLVKEALDERCTMIDNASYMNHKISIVIPCTNSLWSSYYYIGSVFYHLVYWFSSRKGGISFNFPFFASRQDLQIISPYISSKYTSGVVYEDGQFNDSQMNLALLLTATVNHPDPKIKITPGNILNQARVTGLNKVDGKMSGVTVKDIINDAQFEVKAKYVINCTGVFADKIRKMDDPNVFNRIIPVAGSHMSFDQKLIHRKTGICIPSSDGRILLVLPWLGKTIVGTTEKTYQQPIQNPVMTYEQKQFIIKELLQTFDKLKVDELYSMHSSSWTGLRPLVLESGAKDTKSISRKHVIEKSASGLYSLMGGKWTTYRRMAEDLVDEIQTQRATAANGKFVQSSTHRLKLVGSFYRPNFLNQLYVNHPKPLVDHLFRNYGGMTEEILKGNTEIIDMHTLVSKAQVDFIIQNEMPNTIEDVLLRRTRIAFLDNMKVKAAIPYVAEALANYHGWSSDKKKQQINKFNEHYEKLQF